MSTGEVVKGDLLEAFCDPDSDYNVLVHGCNCFNSMGAGFAKQLAKRFPEVEKLDSQTEKGDFKKLGSIGVLKEVTDSGKSVYIINAYIQYYYGKRFNHPNMPHANYTAIESCFLKVREQFKSDDFKICYPAIGSGLAGGNSKVIDFIINQSLDGVNHTKFIL